jgi:hypothetical protein
MSDPIEDALNRMKPAEMPPELMARLTAARSQVAEGARRARDTGRSGWGMLTRWLLPALGCAAVAVATVLF